MSPYELSIIAAKTAIVVAFVTVLIRLLGKRFAGQMNVYDLVTVVAVANALQNALTEGKGNLSVGLVSSFVLIATGWAVSRLLLRKPELQRALVGTPSLLIYEGEVRLDHLKKEHVSVEELCAAMHQHGLTHFKEVGMAVLELDGSISIVPAGRSCKFDTDLA